MTTIEPVTVPLREDPPGVFRVGDTRVLFEVVVQAFRCGATPETNRPPYDTLSLLDVYAVLSYCLTHREQIDDYMHSCDHDGVHVQNRGRESAAGPEPSGNDSCPRHVTDEQTSITLHDFKRDIVVYRRSRHRFDELCGKKTDELHLVDLSSLSRSIVDQ